MDKIVVDTDKYKAIWDNDKKIMTVKFIGDLGDDDAKAYSKSVIKAVKELRSSGEKVDKGIIDLSDAGTPSLNARLTLSKTSKQIVEGVEKPRLAYVGADVFNKLVTSFVHTIVPQHVDIKFFFNDNEAITWLNS